MFATCTLMHIRRLGDGLVAAKCSPMFDAETGEKYDKGCERKLTYCFITCNFISTL